MAALALTLPVHAEKADKGKPTQIEANRMSADDTRKVNIFEGNVVLTKGTINVRADRIVVRQDAEGFQHTTATGTPVRFKQRMDPKEGEKEAHGAAAIPHGRPPSFTVPTALCATTSITLMSPVRPLAV